MKFSRNTTVKGVDKELRIINGKFVDANDEIIDIAAQIVEAIGEDVTFELSITQKISE